MIQIRVDKEGVWQASLSGTEGSCWRGEAAGMWWKDVAAGMWWRGEAAVMWWRGVAR